MSGSCMREKERVMYQEEILRHLLGRIRHVLFKPPYEDTDECLRKKLCIDRGRDHRCSIGQSKGFDFTFRLVDNELLDQFLKCSPRFPTQHDLVKTVMACSMHKDQDENRSGIARSGGAWEGQVNAGVMEPLTPMDDEIIATFVFAAVTSRADLYRVFYRDGYTDRRAYEIAEMYREARQVQRKAAETSRGGDLTTLLDLYLDFYDLRQPIEATRDELVLPVLVACHITAAFAALEDRPDRWCRRAGLSPPAMSEAARSPGQPRSTGDAGICPLLLTHHFPRQGEKRKRQLPPMSDLARDLSDLYRRGIAAYLARRTLAGERD